MDEPRFGRLWRPRAFGVSLRAARKTSSRAQAAAGWKELMGKLRSLADRLGLTTTPSQELYDLVVVGGGPAGLAAAVYGASEGLRTVLVERTATGGASWTSSAVRPDAAWTTWPASSRRAGSP